CVFQVLQNLDCLTSKKINFKLDNFKEKLQKQKNWEKYKLICETLKDLTCGARFEMTMFYEANFIEDFDWDIIDYNYNEIFETFKDHIVTKVVCNTYESPVWFFPSKLINEYMRYIGNEINNWLTHFYQQ